MHGHAMGGVRQAQIPSRRTSPDRMKMPPTLPPAYELLSAEIRFFLGLKQANADGFLGCAEPAVDAQGECGSLSRPFVLVRVVGLSMSRSAVKGRGGSERPNSDVRWVCRRRPHAAGTPVALAAQRPMQLVDQAEEHVQPGVPTQQPIHDHAATCARSGTATASRRSGTS